MWRNLAGALGLALLLTGVDGCRRESKTADDLQVAVSFARTPPAMGDAPLTLDLSDATGQPVAGAEVRVEGNMNHAGMVPTFAALHETQPGQYSGLLKLTMPGDWFVLVTIKLPSGQQVERKIDVPGVRAS